MCPIPEPVEEIPEPEEEPKKETVKSKNDKEPTQNKQTIQDGKKLLQLLGNGLVLRVKDLRKHIVSQ